MITDDYEDTEARAYEGKRLWTELCPEAPEIARVVPESSWNRKKRKLLL